MPAAPIIANDTIGSTNKVTLTGTAEAKATVTVFDGSSNIGTTTADGTGAWSFTSASLSNGTHPLSATQTDAAGLTSALSQAVDPVIGSSPPPAPPPPAPPPPVSPPPAPPPVVAPPALTSFSPDSGIIGDGITNVTHLTLSGSAAPNSTVTVFDGAAKLGSATANASGAWNLPTVLNDGTHSLTATETVSGTTSKASAALKVTVDSHVPAAPIISSDVVGSTNKASLSGTAEANAAVTLYDGSTKIGNVSADGTGAWNFTTASLLNGTHVLAATQTDVAGTTSALSKASNPTIGSIPTPVPVPNPGPVVVAPPTLTRFSTDTGVVGDHITNANIITLSGRAAPNSKVAVADGSTKIGTTTADSSGHWSLTTAKLADGQHAFTATDTVSGVTSAASNALPLIIDTKAPGIPSITSNNVHGHSIFLHGAGEANSSISVFEGTHKLGSTTVDANGAWTLSSGPLSDGAHLLTVVDTDAAGNASKSATVSSTIGAAIAPNIPSITGVDSPGEKSTGNASAETTAHTATLDGTADKSSAVSIFDGAKLLGMTSADSNGNWHFAANNLLTGTHVFTAAEKVGGQTSGPSAAFSLTVDAASPSTTPTTSDTWVKSLTGLLSSVDNLTKSVAPIGGGGASTNLSQVKSFNFQPGANTQLGTSMQNVTGAHSLDANLQMFADAMNHASVTAADTTTAGPAIDASGLSHLTKITAGAEFHFI